MPALPSYMYRDPMLVLIGKQAAAAKRSCAGCTHIRVVEDPFGGKMTRCLKGRPYGKKCSKYERGAE